MFVLENHNLKIKKIDAVLWGKIFCHVCIAWDILDTSFGDETVNHPEKTLEPVTCACEAEAIELR